MRILGMFGDDDAPSEAKPKRKPATATRVRKVPNKTEETKAQGAIAFGITVADYIAGTFFPGRPIFETDPVTQVDHVVGFEGGLWPPEDRLNVDEIELLSTAIYGELAQKPDLVIQLAKLASAKGAHARLLQACALVALPRFARRGILPQEMADKLSLLLMLAPIEDDGLDGISDSASEQDPGPVESGPAYGGDWTDRAGQVDRDRMAAETAPVRPDPQSKTRRRGVQGNGAESQGGFLEEESPGAVGAGTSVLKAGNGIRESV